MYLLYKNNDVQSLGPSKTIDFGINVLSFFRLFKTTLGVTVPILPPLVDFDAIFDFRNLQKATLWTTFFVRNIDLELPGGSTETVLVATLLFLKP